ncbi:glucose 1-dehydrogenase [Deinococcus sp. Marseille-Q6407]|uniref:glucose 1-dehydrogenase n=1 Tax=Deinococcus sp. Marseille-Q6407 TaxID=2969223 RepID=UPI0021BF1679|nr:glucose 1-dehydrogenase [Deinococcus sp. Marseille-Q6407]
MELQEHPLFGLKGQVALITGGGSGLGLQMAEALTEMGASVVLCARKLERCEAAAAALRERGAQAVAVACNVTDPASVQNAVQTAVDTFGRLDILINNAGTTWAAPVEDMTLEQWNKVVDTNLTGVFLCSQAAGRVMLQQGSGAIINITSVAGLRGTPSNFPVIGYSASKGGVVSFTRNLAWKWGPKGIRVNAIAPGWFPSDMSRVLLQRHEKEFLAAIPLGRFGGENDLKGAAIFLASPASAYMTGQVLVVDGGQTA